MTLMGWTQIGLYLVVLLVLAKPLGIYIARVYMKAPCGLDRLLGPVEALVYRVCGIRSEEEMSWQHYARAVLLFSFVGMIFLFFVQLFQAQLPLNPQRYQAISFDSAFNTAASFVSNTNWQSYRGESTMSNLVQMLGLTVQNFLSAATGMAVLVALIRGLVRRESSTVGNFWEDLTRTILYILLPLSFLLSIFLVSQGVIQNLGPFQSVSMLQSTHDLAGYEVTSQVLPMGPVASQVAIKQLGTNGGGFFGTNSAHPFENPTPLSNFLEMLAILLIPAALCHTFGRMVGDNRQGWALLAVMTLIFLPLLWLSYSGESHGNPYLTTQGIEQSAGNMEGKEVRFGVANSALWATATAAASNGSVNSMHDSFSPLSGMVSLWLIQLGEIVFGGVGSGLYGMLVFVIVAVFVAGLMVGRTPEYLGKKIEPFEMKMAVLVILIPAALVLAGTAVACVCQAGADAVANPGPHGFTEILYAFSSAANNNGSAFAGLSADTPFYNLALGLVMLAGRFGVIVPVLAMAGSLAAKKRIPASTGTLPTATPLFVLFLVGVILLVGALTFLPALALGPLAEWLMSP